MTPWQFMGTVLAVIVAKCIFELACMLFVDREDDDDDFGEDEA